MKFRLVFLPLVVFFSFSNIHAESLEPAYFPSLISSLKISTPLDFCNEQVPVQMQEVRERLEKELLLSFWHRSQAILYLKRSSRYLPYIEEMLKDNRMPDDLKYVAIAESALRPHVRSNKGALGFWQFMKYTGKKYGLEINSRIDERRNLFASTQAAIRLFQDLHSIFGSWTLAAAAYNMGEEGLMAEIIEQGTNDYYQLYLPLETQRYIFRILAIKLILNDPAKYGFYLSEEDYYPPLSFERIQVQCSEETPIRIVAQAAQTNFKAIKDLNPEIRGHYLQEGNHTILVPNGASMDFQVRYRNLLKHWEAGKRERIYYVREGDSLTTIADRFGVPLSSLLIWNRLNPRGVIHPGDKLIIYRNERKPIAIDNDESNSNAGS